MLKLKVKKDAMDNSWVHQRVDDSSWRVKCHLAGRKRSGWKGETRSPLCRSRCGETVKVIPLRGLLFAGEGGAKRIFDQSRSRVGTCVLVVVGRKPIFLRGKKLTNARATVAGSGWMYIKNILKIEICYRVTFVIVRIFNSCLIFHFLERISSSRYFI